MQGSVMPGVTTAVAEGKDLGALTSTHRPDVQQRLAQSGGVLLLASAFGNGLNYLLGIVLARALGASQFGLYALGMAMVTVLTLIGVFGLDRGVVKYVSMHLGNQESDKARQILTSAASLAGIFGVVGALTLVLLAKPLAEALYEKPDLIPALWILAAGIPLMAITTVLLAGLQGHQTVRPTVLIKYGWEPVAKMLVVLAALWAGWSLEGILLLLVLVWCGTAVLAVAGTRRVGGVGMADVGRWNTEGTRTLLSYCVPLSVATVFGVLASRSDLLILGRFVSLEEVGVYQAAFQTSAVLALILGSFETAFAPLIGRSFAQGKLAQLEDLYRAVSRLSVIVAIPVCVLFVCFSSEILGWFGSTFRAGMACLAILTVGQLVSCATGGADTILLMAGRSRLYLNNTLLYSVVLLAAALTLIPLWGLLGGALAAAGSLALIGVVRTVQVSRLFALNLPLADVVKPLGAGLVSASAVLVLKPWIATSVYPVLAVLSIGLFLLALWGMGGLHPADRLAASQLLDRLRTAAS
jgi:O-antigen/teichoic acid export membrane protein